VIARKSFLIVSTRFIVRFLGWVGLVVLAKQWGSFAPEAMGIIGFAMSFLGLFNIIGNLGFDKAHIKRVSEGKDFGRCLGTFISIKLVLIVVMVTIILIGIYIWKTLLGGGFTDATTESVVFVFILYYIFLNLQQITTFTFQGTKEIAKRQLVELAEGIVKTPLVLLVVTAGVSIAGVSITPAFSWPDFLEPLRHFLANHPTGSLAMTYVFAVAAPFIVGVWLIRQYTVKKPNKKIFSSYFIFALPMLLTSVIGVIAHNVDKVTIGYFWDATEVGYYFTVQQVTNFLMMLYSSLSFVLFPTLSTLHAQNAQEKLRNTVNNAERHISMIMIPPVFFILVFSIPIIRIMLNTSFYPASSVLITLSFYHLFYGLNVPFGNLISGINRPSIVAKNTVFISILNIILNIIIIPEGGILSPLGVYGAFGAAVATLLSFFIGFIRLRFIARKHVKIKLFPSFLFKHFFAGSIMAVTLFLINKYVFTSLFIMRWYHLLGLAGLGLLIYIVVLIVIKEFNKDDLWFYLDIINLKKMIIYIRDEFKRKK